MGTDLSPSVLLFQPRPCPGILALPSNHGSRPSAQRHGLHDTPFTSAVIFAAISPFFVLLPAGEGFRHYSQGGYERVRYQTCTPTVLLRRGFRTNPNPNYAKHVDPDNATQISRQSSPAPAFTPSAYTSRETTPFSGITPRPAIRQPQFRKSMGGAISSSTSTGDGGSLGVYNHVNSPLKKATSMYDIQARDPPRNSFDMASREIQEQRERSKSPAKRQSDAPRTFLQGRVPFPEIGDDRRSSTPAGLSRRPGNAESPYKRGPSRF